MKKRYSIIIIILLIILLGGGVWFGLERNKKEEIKKQEVIKQEEIKTDPKEISEIDTSDWQTYKDEKYGFEIKHNPNWEIKKVPAPGIGGDWSSVVFIKNREDISMNIARLKSDKKPKEWIKEQGILGVTYEKEVEINGYPIYYTESDIPNTYFQREYMFYRNNIIISFSFSEKYYKRNLETGKMDEVSFSEYLPDFEAMVNSIKFID